MVRGTFSKYRDPHALQLLHEVQPSSPAAPVQIASPAEKTLEETHA
jgi:hypothetical protein